ncbi:MAG: SGNH/GDSL hydrolase family protein [Cyanobacteria bacterium P01_A01_bin.123]
MNASLDFDRLVLFGDSLTDTGGTFELSSQNLIVPLPPESLGYAQRFSNGEVYADIAPCLLGIEDVDNFALSAAASLGELTFGTILALSVVSLTIFQRGSAAGLQFRAIKAAPVEEPPKAISLRSSWYSYSSLFVSFQQIGPKQARSI